MRQQLSIFLLLLFFSAPLSLRAQQSDIDWMPIPEKWELAGSGFTLNKGFTVGITQFTNKRLNDYSYRFLRRLDLRTGLFFKQQFVAGDANADLKIEVKRAGKLTLGEDESYQLTVSSEGIILKAETDFGAMRGLETLLQLLSSTEETYLFRGIKIDDAPRFPWRGLMIDVSRHFHPLDVIKRNIDGMAAVKMNVLHMHLVDDHGFRVESKRYPQLHEKASNGEYYSQDEIRELVQYAGDRGIRVVPEFDVPGHASAFLTAFPELGSAGDDYQYQLQTTSGIFDPTLDPTNEATYETLNGLFTEMSALFPDEYFHIGGDENEGKHWMSNPKILRFMKENGYADIHALQNYFVIRIQKHLTSLGKKTMGWDEILNDDLPKDAIIHSWRGISSLEYASTNGYKCLLSNGYYIDLMQRASDHYLNDPIPAGMQLSEKAKANIMGGEATMWSELVVPQTVDSRIWPRVAAIAERLWSPADIRDVDYMYKRLDKVSLQLELLGLGHQNNQHLMMRNLVGGYDTQPLEDLEAVSEPMEWYTRNPNGNYYLTYYAFNRFADITTADARDARLFTNLVKEYQQTGAAEARKQIISWLRKWSENYPRMKQLRKQSPALEEVMELSKKLSVVAALGLEALELPQMTTQDQLDWWQNAEGKLDEATEQTARTELQVVEPIRALCKMMIGVILVPKVADQIKVDGDTDDWEPSIWQLMTPVFTRGWSDTCVLNLKWDAKQLYIAAVVSNEQLTRAATASDAGEDGIMVQLKVAGKYYLLRARMPEKSSFISMRNSLGIAYRYALRTYGTVNDQSDNDNFFEVEFAVDWASIGITPEPGLELGFNLVVTDQNMVHLEPRRFDFIGLGGLGDGEKLVKVVLQE